MNKKQEWYDRYLEIVELRKNSRVWTLNKLGEKYGVSRERIRQILDVGVQPPVIKVIKVKVGSRYREYSGKDRINAYVRVRHHKEREEIIAGLGGKCARCGVNDIRVLQIDHINGGGVKEHKSLGSYYLYKQVREMIKSGTAKEKYQLLCANCNWIKRAENNENAGKENFYNTKIVSSDS